MRAYKIFLNDDSIEKSFPDYDTAISYIGTLLVNLSLKNQPGTNGIKICSYQIKKHSLLVMVDGEQFAKIFPCYGEE